KNKIIGFVHTKDFLERPRHIKTDVKAEALKTLIKIRKRIIAGELTESKISGRSSNITTTKQSTIGTAVRNNEKKAWKDSSDTFGGDSDIIFSIVTDISTVGNSVAAIMKKRKLKNKESKTPIISVDPNLKLGTAVALVPVENTGNFKAIPLAAKKVDPALLSWMTTYLRGMYDTGDGDKPLNYPPDKIELMMKSIVNIGFQVEGTAPSTLKFQTIVDQQKGSDSGMITIKWAVGGSNGTLVMAGQKTKESVKGKRTAAVWRYNIQAVSVKGEGDNNAKHYKSNLTQGYKDFFAAISPEVLAEKQLPFYNLGIESVHKAQLDGKKINVPVLQEDGSYRISGEGDYIGNMLLPRTRTNIAPGESISDGKKNYNVNTMITFAEEVVSAETDAVDLEAENRKVLAGLKLRKKKTVAALSEFKALVSIQKQLADKEDKVVGLRSILSRYTEDHRDKYSTIISNMGVEKFAATKFDATVAIADKAIQKLDNSISSLKSSLDKKKVSSKVGSPDSSGEWDELDDILNRLESLKSKEPNTTKPDPVDNNDNTPASIPPPPLPEEGVGVFDEAGMDVVDEVEDTTPSVTLESLLETLPDGSPMREIAQRMVEKKYLRTEKEDGTKC
ncbi:MAG: hypothetical protein DRI46_12230, partial [Chloroflexi bacterium]